MLNFWPNSGDFTNKTCKFYKGCPVADVTWRKLWIFFWGNDIFFRLEMHAEYSSWWCDHANNGVPTHPTCFSGDLDQHNPWFIGSCVRGSYTYFRASKWEPFEVPELEVPNWMWGLRPTERISSTIYPNTVWPWISWINSTTQSRCWVLSWAHRTLVVSWNTIANGASKVPMCLLVTRGLAHVNVIKLQSWPKAFSLSQIICKSQLLYGNNMF